MVACEVPDALRPFGRPKSMNYEREILRLLSERDAGKTICPSEVLSGTDKKNPELMESVREAARRLVAKGEIEITQKGQPIDPATIHGPIRLRKRKP